VEFLEGRSVRRPAGTVLLGVVLVLAPLCVPPASATPLTKPEVIKLVRRNVQENRLLAVVRELGIDFKMSREAADELRAAGASATLIAALRGLSPEETVVVAPAPVASPPVAPPVAAPPPAPTPPAPAPEVVPPPTPPTVVVPPVTPPPPPPPATPLASDPPPRPALPPRDPPPARPVPPVEQKGPSPRAASDAPAPATEPPASPTLPRETRDMIASLAPGPPPPPPPPLPIAAPAPPAEPAPRPPAAAPVEPPAAAPPPAPATAAPLAPAAPAPVPAPVAPAPAAEAAARWEQVRPLLEKAQALAAEGDVRGAQTLVAKAMELDPGDPRVWKTFKGIEQDLLVRAETFLAEGQLPRALREFQFIITTNPESAFGYNGMGQALLQLRNYDEAVAAFEKALVLEPGNARYRQALTRARSLQRASKALEQKGRENLKEMIEDPPGRKKGP
jgi:hypothetical protein